MFYNIVTTGKLKKRGGDFLGEGVILPRTTCFFFSIPHSFRSAHDLCDSPDDTNSKANTNVPAFLACFCHFTDLHESIGSTIFKIILTQPSVVAANSRNSAQTSKKCLQFFFREFAKCGLAIRP